MTNGITSAAIDRFYAETLRSLIAEARIDIDASTLVVCGGNLDMRTLREIGFSNVTISNYDARLDANTFLPYKWAYEDVESLSYPEGAFDQVIEHNGLHHCASPHRALVEMYRVAAKAVVAIEPRDSLCVRAACRLKLSTKYEVDAVIDNGRQFGGLRNSALPNFVYRWTEREVLKTIATFDPTGPVNVSFFHGVALPRPAERDAHKVIRKLVGQVMKMAAWSIERLAPRQGNRFGFWIGKPSIRHPWLDTLSDGLADHWLRAPDGQSTGGALPATNLKSPSVSRSPLTWSTAAMVNSA